MKTKTLKIRVSEAEKDAFYVAAWLTGASVSSWVRQNLRKVAKTQLEEAHKPVDFLENDQ